MGIGFCFVQRFTRCLVDCGRWHEERGRIIGQQNERWQMKQWVFTRWIRNVRGSLHWASFSIGVWQLDNSPVRRLCSETHPIKCSKELRFDSNGSYVEGKSLCQCEGIVWALLTQNGVSCSRFLELPCQLNWILMRLEESSMLLLRIRIQMISQSLWN